MKNLNLFSKITLFLASLSGILWLGSYLARLTISYQLFEGYNFAINYYITRENLPGILQSMNDILLLAAICYSAFILTYILFLVSSRISLKENGWLFISTTIIFITLPFEIYLTTIDYKIYNIVNSTNYNPYDVVNLYIKRLSILGSFPIIELLCYGSIIYFVLFRPFKKLKSTS